jgi:hypothetical protein
LCPFLICRNFSRTCCISLTSKDTPSCSGCATGDRTSGWTWSHLYSTRLCMLVDYSE